MIIFFLKFWSQEIIVLSRGSFTLYAPGGYLHVGVATTFIDCDEHKLEQSSFSSVGFLLPHLDSPILNKITSYKIDWKNVL